MRVPTRRSGGTDFTDCPAICPAIAPLYAQGSRGVVLIEARPQSLGPRPRRAPQIVRTMTVSAVSSIE
jgi:hypothetical protein